MSKRYAHPRDRSRFSTDITCVRGSQNGNLTHAIVAYFQRIDPSEAVKTVKLMRTGVVTFERIHLSYIYRRRSNQHVQPTQWCGVFSTDLSAEKKTVRRIARSWSFSTAIYISDTVNMASRLPITFQAACRPKHGCRTKGVHPCTTALSFLGTSYLELEWL